MAKTKPVQKSFGKGQLDPLLGARDDTALFGSGLSEALNAVVVPQGPLMRRPGGPYLGKVKHYSDPDQAPRMVPWTFRADFAQSYELEFGEGYMRVWAWDGLVLTGGGAVFELATGLSLEAIRAMQFEQSNDVMYLALGSTGDKRHKLNRLGHDDWTIEVIDSDDGPYLDIAESRKNDNHSLTPSGTTGSITVTSNEAGTFKANDVGRQIRLKHTGEWGYVEITAFSSDTVVNADVKRTLLAATATTEWRIGAWGGDQGWPQVVSFFQERLGWGNTLGKPNGVWLSATGDFENHQPTRRDADDKFTDTVVAEDAISITISAGENNPIEWMIEGTSLILGTLGKVRTLAGGGDQQAITPDNPFQEPESQVGSAPIRPAQPKDNVFLFVDKYRRTVYELAYTLEKDGLATVDLNLLAVRITKGKIDQVAWMAKPYPMLWVLLETGQLLSMSYEREQEVTAWMPHQMGGTDAKVRSISVTPGKTQDALFLVVERTIGGAPALFVERQEEFFEPATPWNGDEAFFADCGAKVTGTDLVEVTGLEHLEGETVVLWGDGQRFADKVVYQGRVAWTEKPVSCMILGLKQKWRGVTMGSPTRALQTPREGAKARTALVSLSLMDTAAISVGGEGADKLTKVQFRKAGDGATAALPLFTGEITQRVADRYGSGRVIFEVDGPEPATLRAIAPAQEGEGQV